MIILVDMCLQAKVQPVLVTYPIPQQQITDITKSVADMTGVPWLNLNTQFDLILQNENSNQRFMRYGILTDEGARRIAAIFAKDIISRARPEDLNR